MRVSNVIAGSPRILIIRLSAIGDVVRVFSRAPNSSRSASAGAHRLDGRRQRGGHRRRASGAGRPYRLRALRRRVEKVRASSRGCAATFATNGTTSSSTSHGILKSGLVAAASRAKERIGFARPRSQEGSTLFYDTGRRGAGQFNRAEENLRLCQALASTRRPAPVIYVTDEVQERVHEFTDSEFDSDKLVVAVHAPVDRPSPRPQVEQFVGDVEPGHDGAALGADNLAGAVDFTHFARGLRSSSGQAIMNSLPKMLTVTPPLDSFMLRSRALEPADHDFAGASAPPGFSPQGGCASG